MNHCTCQIYTSHLTELVITIICLARVFFVVTKIQEDMYMKETILSHNVPVKGSVDLFLCVPVVL